jgi:Ca2+/Na+ antiporter
MGLFNISNRTKTEGNRAVAFLILAIGFLIMAIFSLVFNFIPVAVGLLVAVLIYLLASLFYSRETHPSERLASHN